MMRFLKMAACAGFLAVFASACGKGRGIPGIESFRVDVVESHLFVGFRATFLKWDQGITAPVPGLEGASVSLAPDLNSDGSVFQLTVPLAALTGAFFPFPNSTLPDGRDLPGVRTGAMPRWDLPVGSQSANKLQLSFYLSDEAFGVFIPLRLKLKVGRILSGLRLSLPIEDERGNRLGRIYAVPPGKSDGSGSGVWLLMTF